MSENRPLYEKYRPKTLDEMVGQEHVINALRKMVEKKDMPHLLFIGPPGSGKTTAAYALANELGWGIVEFNASDERGIAVIREKVKKLAFSAGKRIILLDEADSLTPDAQHALRRIIERASPSVRFILTGNEEWRIIDPIKSRCAIFRFRKLKDEEVAKIVISVLRKEGLLNNLDGEMKKAIKYLIKYVDGDARKALNLLNSLVMQGREITLANIRLLIPPNIMSQAVKKAWDGHMDEAIEMLEEAFGENQGDAVHAVRDAFRAVKSLDLPKYARAKAYVRIAEAERAMREGADPVIQLAAVLASVWAVRHLNCTEVGE